MIGYKRFLLKTIRKRQLQFFGHIIRADGLEKQILSGEICGTKSKGRQHSKYTDSLNNFETRKESPNNELIRRTDDREDWEAMIIDVCNSPGTMMMKMMMYMYLIRWVTDPFSCFFCLFSWS